MSWLMEIWSNFSPSSFFIYDVLLYSHISRQESDIESPSSFNMASKSEVSRQDYHQEIQSPQAGTSDLCERLQRYVHIYISNIVSIYLNFYLFYWLKHSRFDFVIPSPKAIEKRNNAPAPMAVDDPSVNLPPSPAKRPMNGFMLFAQKYRLQLIQQFPGRDNRLDYLI